MQASKTSPMMKLILTGSTGMIGKEVFSQCIHNQAITSIIVLTRRSLPSDYPSSPKVKVVLMTFPHIRRPFSEKSLGRKHASGTRVSMFMPWIDH